MNDLILIGIDAIAIALLAFGIYFRRHRRRDLLVAFVGVNIGVLAVSLVLASATASIGVGLGLFGVLSIIRLRSTEISQREVAYYFASLAIGLVAGLGGANLPVACGLIALVVAAMAVIDHPGLLAAHRQQMVRIDRAIVAETELVAHLEEILGGRVHRATVVELDLIDDSTLVDVRWSPTSAARLAVAA
ncbi:DUF4956 domain-containing protein [Agrococcus sp. TF02-05]|uniref:DUF4956 domain-containing protein n=1 Tax=Agrococcus sp. TF02-05 TaxID=2815211 RepID=UPI001AA14B92|nr:DUF4956 domain-containing protein [Agrococcus sp. TF02-05]MBO1770442.1 DUF4956 domain-containing protein [Agrococcus sp. TF02-05]